MTLYYLQTSALEANPPRGSWAGMMTLGNPAWSLCLVKRWADDTADDEWEAATNANPIYPETLGATCPLAVVTALAPYGVIATDTLRQALRKVKRHWSLLEGVLQH